MVWTLRSSTGEGLVRKGVQLFGRKRRCTAIRKRLLCHFGPNYALWKVTISCGACGAVLLPALIFLHRRFMLIYVATHRLVAFDNKFNLHGVLLLCHGLRPVVYAAHI